MASLPLIPASTQPPAPSSLPNQCPSLPPGPRWSICPLPLVSYGQNILQNFGNIFEPWNFSSFDCLQICNVHSIHSISNLSCITLLYSTDGDKHPELFTKNNIERSDTSCVSPNIHLVQVHLALPVCPPIHSLPALTSISAPLIIFKFAHPAQRLQC